MTNVNGVNQLQQIAYAAPPQVRTAAQTPQYYTTTPYPNDTFVSSKPKEKHTAGKVVAGTVLTAAAVIGSAVLARRYTDLKNYKVVTENATFKQHLANGITKLADGTTSLAKTCVNKIKYTFFKAKVQVNGGGKKYAEKIVDKYSVGKEATGKEVQKMMDDYVGIKKAATQKAYDKKQKELEKAFANWTDPAATAKPKKAGTPKKPAKTTSK